MHEGVGRGEIPVDRLPNDAQFGCHVRKAHGRARLADQFHRRGDDPLGSFLVIAGWLSIPSPPTRHRWTPRASASMQHIAIDIGGSLP
ncbi:Uncharacterised protein [Mycobacteroides abscessus subsp. abscessus]|nr:Uncharacterised protein [Mycobacteroides abscessus subsp. abscessus]